MVADARRDAGGNLRRSDLDDAVAEGRALARGDGDADIRQEDAVGAENLAELALADILRIDLLIVDDRAQARTRERELGLRVLALQVVDVQCCRKGVLAEVGEA